MNDIKVQIYIPPDRKKFVSSIKKKDMYAIEAQSIARFGVIKMPPDVVISPKIQIEE